VRSVRVYVQGYLADRLEEARTQLRAYADRFTAVMLEALDTARQGETRRGPARCTRPAAQHIRIQALACAVK
jgi:hypothetical protein